MTNKFSATRLPSIRFWLPVIVAGLSITGCQRATPPAEASLAELRTKLSTRFPTVQIRTIHPAPVAGLFEIVTDSGISYADASGDHLLLGRLMDTATKRDLSSEAWDRHHPIDFAKLPLDNAIKTTRGDGSRVLAVFADPDCPFCRTLEKDLGELANATIYTFLFPIESTHPGSTDKARHIWCAADRQNAWHKLMLEGREPTATVCSGDPIDATIKLGIELSVASTPTIFLASGQRLSGTMPLDQLERALAESARVLQGRTGADPLTTNNRSHH